MDAWRPMKNEIYLLLFSSLFLFSSCGKNEAVVADAALSSIRSKQATQPQPETKPTGSTPITEPKPGEKPELKTGEGEVPPPPNNPSLSDDEILIQAALAAANKIRAENRAPELILDEQLAAVAQKHAEDMSARNFFDHSNPEKETPFDRMKKSGVSFSAGAENIAMGVNNAQEVMAGWLASPGHKVNLLNKAYGRHGIGFKNGYWVHLFAD